MNRHRQSATWLGAVLGTVCALLILALGAHASDHRGALTVEFHQTYPLTADGRIELDNINGDVDRKSTRLNSSHLVISYAVFLFNKTGHGHSERIITRNKPRHRPLPRHHDTR